MSATVRIAVIDDHPIYRAGVIRTLNNEVGFEVVGEGSSAEEAIRIAIALQPDLMILDVGMPGGGLEAARTIAGVGPDIAIMMLTVTEDDGFVMSALQAGAKAYVLKGISGPELIQTVRTMLEGESVISPELAARILAEDHADSTATIAFDVSQLGRNILSLVIGGAEPQEVANRLGLDVRTVRLEIAAILKLLRNASASAERARHKTRNGLLH